MKKVVVDSSVAIKWFVPQPDSIAARKILDAYRSDTLVILAPDLIYVEVGNVIWKLHRFQGISQADGKEILNLFQSIDFAITSSLSLLLSAYDLAVTCQRTVYDSLYLALSLQEKCEFVTADEKLVNSVNHSFPNVIALKNWTL